MLENGFSVGVACSFFLSVFVGDSHKGPLNNQGGPA
jgi:hypothetical protein